MAQLTLTQDLYIFDVSCMNIHVEEPLLLSRIWKIGFGISRPEDRKDGPATEIEARLVQLIESIKGSDSVGCQNQSTFAAPSGMAIW